MAIAFVLAAALVLIEILGLAASWSALRSVAIRRKPTGRPATVVLAVTGDDGGLPDLLACLAAQSDPIRRLVAAVESLDDPAAAAVEAARADAPFPIDLIVAGLSQAQGQKAHNVAAAVASLRPEDRSVVLIDADIRPQPWWLATLQGPLAAGFADAATGYRWQSDVHDLGSAVLATIDRGMATVPWRNRAGIVWGGSTALTRDCVDAVDIPAVLAGTVSDDLSLGAALRRGGLRVSQRGGILVPTPAGTTRGIRFNFLVRQYRIVRVHRPPAFALALAVLAVRIAAWGTLAAAAVAAPLAALPLAAACALGVGKAVVRDRIAAAIDRPDDRRARALLLAVAALPPLTDLPHAAAAVLALASRRLRWGRIDYALDARDRTRVLARRPYDGLRETDAASPSGPSSAARHA